MKGIDFGSHPNLLVGLAKPDDAGVYKLNDEIALVQTVDFFTPIVDDPFTFGQIAAANALSDVYAMGGRPITAMNLVTFPQDTMPISVLRDILRGGLDKATEAECPIVGGHSVKAPELKYGLSITGTVHPDKIWTNLGARPNDVVLLTKPLGTGIVSTAIKGGVVDSIAADTAAESMAALNRVPAEVAGNFDVHACTDVTGFGLVGHGAEMMRGTGLGFEIDGAAIPLLPNVDEYCDMGLLPGGLSRNRNFVSCRLKITAGVPQHIEDVICDPQTSGGLLIAVSPEEGPLLAEALARKGIRAPIIGRFVADEDERILVK